MFWDILGFQNWGRGLLLASSGQGCYIRPCIGYFPTTEGNQGQHVNSDKAEKPAIVWKINIVWVSRWEGACMHWATGVHVRWEQITTPSRTLSWINQTNYIFREQPTCSRNKKQFSLKKFRAVHGSPSQNVLIYRVFYHSNFIWNSQQTKVHSYHGILLSLKKGMSYGQMQLGWISRPLYSV